MAEIINRKTVDLDPLYNNPRFIRDNEFISLCNSLRDNPEYFEARPLILSDRTGLLVVIAGNMRLKAAVEIGLKEVPSILLSGLTEEKEQEIIIRDNVNSGSWDYDILANEWDKDKLVDWGVPALWDLNTEDMEEPELPKLSRYKVTIEVESQLQKEEVKTEIEELFRSRFPDLEVK